MLCFKAKLQLSDTQRQKISQFIVESTQLYNLILNLASEQDGLPSVFSLQAFMKDFDLPTDVAQGQIQRACNAVVRSRTPDASGRLFGKPRFKTPKVKTNSIDFSIRSTRQEHVYQVGKVVWVRVPELGWVKARIGREVVGTIKQVAIKCDSCGTFWLTINTTALKPDTLPAERTEAIGVDLGVKTTATASNESGSVVIQPVKKRFLDDKNLAALKHSANKDRKSLPFVHRKIARRRDHYNWNLAREIMGAAKRVYVGDVSPKWLIVGKFAKQASDMGLFSLKQKMLCLAASANRVFEVIDESYTSKTCHNCGSIKKDLTLKDRVYECSCCGFVLDRDQNAARNICKKGERLRLRNNTEADTQGCC